MRVEAAWRKQLWLNYTEILSEKPHQMERAHITLMLKDRMPKSFADWLRYHCPMPRIKVVGSTLT